MIPGPNYVLNYRGCNEGKEEKYGGEVRNEGGSQLELRRCMGKRSEGNHRRKKVSK